MKLGFAAVLVSAGLATQPAQIFKASTDLVTVPLSVASREQALPELHASDFAVFEDGVAQQIVAFDHTPRPVSLCIVLDSSPSMEADRRLMARYTVETIFRGLVDRDEAAIITFASDNAVAIPWTPARELPAVRWLEWGYSPGTALMDALQRGIAYTDEARNPLRVIVIVSDGGENASRIRLSNLAKTSRQSETLVYAIQTGTPVVAPGRGTVAGVEQESPRTTQRQMPVGTEPGFSSQIVDESGGRLWVVQNPTAAADAARALLAELRALYVIGYVPAKPPDGMYRRISVKPTRQGMTVRHRGGYLAASRTP